MMTSWIRGWKYAVFLSAILCSYTACALTLDEAKNQALVGETLSGYLAVIESNNPQALKLVTDINAQRQQKYTEIARNNQLKTAEVAKIAGAKLIERASSGEYVRGLNGQWLKKK